MQSKTIDLRGLKCPEPLKRTEAELSLITEGVLIALVESPSNWNLERFAKKSGLRLESKKHKDYWELKIIKTPMSRPDKEGILNRALRSMRRGEKAQGLKDMMLVISQDVFGKEEVIGKTLMQAFLDTMLVMNDIPAFMFFMNSGVLLTTANDEIIPILKNIEARGAEIYSCSTCLKHFNLEDKLKVGQAGGMATLTDGMRKFKKVMTI